MDPEWLSELLARCWGRERVVCREAGWARAWVVGGVQSGETLVLSRPVVREPGVDFVPDFLRVASPTIVAAHVARQEPELHRGRTPVGRPGLARFQAWIGVRAEGEVGGEEDEAALRERIVRGLPDFLIRSLGAADDRDLGVFAFFAALHAQGALGRTAAAPPQVRRALAAVDELLGRPAQIHMIVSDGRTVGVLHRGGQLSLIEPTPPAQGRQPRTVAHRSSPRSACLLIHHPNDALPEGTGRRLAEGVFTVHVRQAEPIERD